MVVVFLKMYIFSAGFRYCTQHRELSHSFETTVWWQNNLS